MKTSNEDPILLTRVDAARLLAVSPRTVVNLERRGILSPIRLGAAVRYTRAALDAAIEKLAAPRGAAIPSP